MVRKGKKEDSLKVSKTRETPNSSPQKLNRTASNGVSPRKVSDGIKQLGPDVVRLLREVWSLLDTDGSGVDRVALQNMLSSLGIVPAGEMATKMVERTGEPVTFAAFVAVMAVSMGNTPEKQELDYAFSAFEDSRGLQESNLKLALQEEGLSSDEISAVWKRYTRRGKFDKQAFVDAMGI